MTRFWWVRHGPTGAKGMVGWTDLAADLSDAPTLARLRAYLPEAPVISSDLSRAVATADAIAGDRPRLPADPQLREMHFGRWEMRRFDDMAPEEEERLRAFYDHPGEVRPPGGESWDDIVSRVAQAVDHLLARGLPDIIVVSHMGAILTQVQRAEDITAYEAFGYRIEPLSVSRILHENGCWTAEAINHCP